MDLYAIQRELELEMQGAGLLRFAKNNQRAIDGDAASDTQWFRRLTREFVKPMADAIDAYKEYYKGRRGKPSATIAHLNCLNSEAAAYIAIKTIFDALKFESASAQGLATSIGRRVEDEIRFTKLNESAPEYIAAIKNSLKKRANQSYKFEHDTLVHAEKELKLLSDFQRLVEGGVQPIEIRRLLNLEQAKYDQLLDKVEYAIDIDRWVPWSQADTLQLGSKLIDVFANYMLLDGKPLIARMNVSTFAVGAGGNRKTPVAIVATEALEKWVEEYKQVMGAMSPAYEPCVVQPRDWTSPFNGGYHTKEVSSKLNLVRCRDKRHLRKLTRKQMPKVYQAVNALQAVKWRVNNNILNVSNEIRGRGLPLGMPSMDKADKPLCPVPAIYSDLRGAELLACLDEDQQEAFKEWKTKTVAYYHDEQKRRADVRETIATIDQAIKFSAYDVLHFVYTLDFRSRVYSQSSLLSPQGGDLQKALIQFKDSCALGESGGYWFKVHGANVWGWDKESFSERVSRCETEEFKEMCLDIAADPVTFTQWTGADKPWQFLAWCFEYAELLEWIEEGNREQDFESRVAVAMDGSCSGIQHYSAMLRDEVGGKEVNLTPSDMPQDIYRAVSDIVTSWMESIIDDHTQDLPNWDEIAAKYGAVKGYKFAEEWLRITINRNMTKKSVMTLPYGSSQLTCRDSIGEYLDDIQAKANKQALATGKPLGDVHCFTNKKGDLPVEEAKTFASGLTWKAIGEVVIAARAAMKYIKEVTNFVATAGHALEWPTPLGFLVKQEIFEVSEDKRINSMMLGLCQFRVKEDTNVIDIRRMKSSCAPNFVHSMDASHLMLAVVSFDDNGITSITVIHDSFGTHAGKTELLRSLLTGSFVDMYLENDVIAQFKEYNEEKLMMLIDVELPPTGNLDLEQVRHSMYAFG